MIEKKGGLLGIKYVACKCDIFDNMTFRTQGYTSDKSHLSTVYNT